MASGDLIGVIDHEHNLDISCIGFGNVVKVGSEIYALPYQGALSGHLKIATIQCSDIGDVNPVAIDTEEDGDSNQGTQWICKITESEDKYAVVSDGSGNDGYLRTFQITPGGAISSMIDEYEFDTTFCFNPRIMHIAGNIYAIVYTSSSGVLTIRTIHIGTDGFIVHASIDALSISHTSLNGQDICYVAGNVYCVLANGSTISKVYTVEIDTAGNIGAASIASLTLSIGNLGGYGDIVPMHDQYFACGGSAGRICMVTISEDGLVIAETGSYTPTNTSKATIIRLTNNVIAEFYDDTVSTAVAVRTLNWSDAGVYVSVQASGFLHGQSPITYDLRIPAVRVDINVFLVFYCVGGGLNLTGVTCGISQEGSFLQIAFAQSVFTAYPVWTDVSPYMMDLHTKRGRMHELDRIEAGVIDLTLNNKDGAWWRNNDASPFYPNLKPITLLRLCKGYNSIIYPVWYGVIESIEPGWLEERGGFSPIEIMKGVDLFKTIGKFMLKNANPLLITNATSGQKDVIVDSIDGDLKSGMWLRIYDDDNEELNVIASIDTSTLTITMTTNLAHTYQVSRNAKVKNYPRPAGGLHMYSGQRVDDVLTALGILSIMRDTDLGICEVMELTPPPGGENALEHLQAVAEAEQGILFVGCDGKVVFQDNEARTTDFRTSQATLTDAGGNSKYILPELVDDDTFIYNEAQIAGDGIVEQILSDPDSQDLIGIRCLSRKGSLLYKSTDALDQAFLIVGRYTDSFLRCSSLLIFPMVVESDLYPKVLGYEISTRITLVLNSARNPAQLNRPYHIEGIEHEWSAKDDLWQTRWQLWDAIQPLRIFRDGRQTCHAGYLDKYDSVYLTAHNAALANDVYNDPAEDRFRVGQWSSGGVPGAYDIFRAVLAFDTSALGIATIESAILALTLDNGYSGQLQVIGQTFDLVIVNPSTAGHYPLIVADYGTLLPQTTSCGSITIAESAYPKNTIITIQLNATGLALINKTGVTYFALRSSRDISSTPPVAGPDEDLFFQGIGSELPPRLIVRIA